MIINILIFVWVLIFCATISIGVTMLTVGLVRKDGLDDIDVTNLAMVEVCVFAVVLIMVLLIWDMKL